MLRKTLIALTLLVLITPNVINGINGATLALFVLLGWWVRELFKHAENWETP